jgi:thiamine pyrophosphate-dependent acetolactate synthase large subunit-like protein
MAPTTSRVNDPVGGRPMCDRRQIEQAADLLARARRPVLLTGGGTVSASAESELVGLARRLGAPVISTVMGRGAMPETDPLWVGVLSNKYASGPLFEEADVVLAVGCRFAHRSTQGLLLNLSFRPEQTLIHLDLDPTVIGKLFPATLGMSAARDGLRGDVRRDWEPTGRLRVARPSSGAAPRRIRGEPQTGVSSRRCARRCR